MKLLEMITGKKKPLTDADKARMNPALFKQEMAHRQNQSTSQAIGASIGDRATDGKEAYNLADLEMFEGTDAPDVQGQATAGTNATGLRSMMTPEMVPYLDMAENMAASGDAKGAMDIISKLQTDSGRSEDAKKYHRAQRQGYEGTFLDFTKEIRRANQPSDMAHLPLGAKAKGYLILDAEGNRSPVTDAAVTLNDVQNQTGLPKGSSYINAPSAGVLEAQNTRDAALTIYDVVDDALFVGDNPIFGDDYNHDAASQLEAGKAHMTQSDPRLAAYTDYINGVAGQIARTVSGEKGALREEDIQRAIGGLLPKIAYVDTATGNAVKGDSKAVAKIKMRRLRKMLKLPASEMNEELEELEAIQGDKEKSAKPEGAMYEIYVDGKKTWADANGDPI